MENKKKKYTIVIVLLVVVLLVIGVSYAYWILTKQQEGTNVVNTVCLSMDIESESDDFLSFYKCFL